MDDPPLPGIERAEQLLAPARQHALGAGPRLGAQLLLALCAQAGALEPHPDELAGELARGARQQVLEVIEEGEAEGGEPPFVGTGELDLEPLGREPRARHQVEAREPEQPARGLGHGERALLVGRVPGLGLRLVRVRAARRRAADILLLRRVGLTPAAGLGAAGVAARGGGVRWRAARARAREELAAPPAATAALAAVPAGRRGASGSTSITTGRRTLMNPCRFSRTR